jgi:hypothetical protein
MRVEAIGLLAGIGLSALTLPSGTAVQPMICHVEVCQPGAAMAVCDPELVSRANRRCDAWAAAAAAGRLPLGGRAPKPVAGATTTFRVRALQACIARRVWNGMRKVEAIGACGDELKG